MTRDAHCYTIHYKNGAIGFRPCYCPINKDHEDHPNY